MCKPLFSFFILTLFAFTNAKAQKKTGTFTSKLISHEVTYNASPKPNECWEAVQWGIKIKDGKHELFFSMNYKEIEKIKAKVGDKEVQIEVIYFAEPDEAGALGGVSKISLNNEVLYENK